jgi:outer membrane protein assembly factor BamB
MTAPAFTEGHRGALLIGAGAYDHPDLADLLSPAVDCAQLAEVLRDREIGGFEVHDLVDADIATQMRAIEQFFAQAQPQDVRLLYLSCHGIVNPRDGKLHFATGATDPAWPGSSSISASFVHDQMEACWARSIVVVLDCCYSGRFLPGAKGEDGPAGFERALAGRGRVIITAGTRTQRTYEGEHPDPAAPALSRFTGPFVEGLRTGAADLDGDGLITVRELYEYVCGRLHAEGVEQNPLMGYEVQNDIALARVKPKPKPKRSRAPRPAPPPARSDLPWRTVAALGAAHQPVLTDGLLLMHEKYQVHVIDAETRRRILLVPLKHPGRPAFHGSTAYFPDRGRWLRAVDLRTGRPRRSPRLQVGEGVLGVCGDVLYAPGSDDRLHAVDLVTGQERHPRLPLRGRPVVQAPQVAGGSVLVMAGGGTGHIIAVDPVTGVPAWCYEAEEPLSGGWAVTEQGVHVVERAEGTPGQIVTLDPATGETLWTYRLTAELAAAPAAADGLVVLGDVALRLIALDARTGDKAWQDGAKEPRTEGRLLTRPAVGGGTLYAADRAGRLTAWRLRDGRRLNSRDLLLSRDFHGSPAYGDGAMYVTDSHGYLHALPAR